jgi:hypothetical protein
VINLSWPGAPAKKPQAAWATCGDLLLIEIYRSRKHPPADQK